MPKYEKIKFSELINVFSEKPPRIYSDGELLEVVRSPSLLSEINESEQLRVVGAITERMQSSEDFRRRVLEEIEKSHP